MAGQSSVPNEPGLSPEMRKFLDGLKRGLGAVSTEQIGAAGTTQQEFGSWLIKGPLNQDYRIIERIPYGMTFGSVHAKLASGTCTITLKIGSTPMTGGAINATSTQQSSTITAANVAAEGDVLVATISSISSPVDLTFTVEWDRVLAN